MSHRVPGPERKIRSDSLAKGLMSSRGPRLSEVENVRASNPFSQQSPALYRTYAAEDQKSFLFFPQTTGLDGAKVGPVLAQPEADLTAPEKIVRDAVIHGGRMSLKWTALVPLTMAVGYSLLILYFKTKGGYKQVHIEGVGKAAHDVPGTGAGATAI